MLTTKSLREMLDKEQSQDKLQVHLKISCSRELAESILRGKCPAITVKLEEEKQQKCFLRSFISHMGRRSPMFPFALLCIKNRCCMLAAPVFSFFGSAGAPAYSS